MPVGTAAAREFVAPQELRLPSCPLPRPGEEVVWYTDAFKRAGVYLGHAPGGKPIVQPADGIPVSLRTFSDVRLADPFSRRSPIWADLPATTLVRPSAAEAKSFRALLSCRIPPGPSYMDLIEEVWHRGFEIFLVGGTVRDVLAGGEANDVDLVTSMPLRLAVPLLTSMYRSQPKIDEDNGYVRLAGPADDGAPYIDLKTLVYRGPGTREAVFGCDIRRDMRHRDFACNSVYYDPINEVLLDPSGAGVRTAEARELEIVFDPEGRAPYFRAMLILRAGKFRLRGYTYSVSTVTDLQSVYLPDFVVMKDSDILAYAHRQIFAKLPAHKREDVVPLFEGVFRELGATELWDNRVSALIQLLARGGGA